MVALTILISIMGRGGGNGRRSVSTGSRGTTRCNNGVTQGSNNIEHDREPLSSPMETGLENTPVNADDFSSESSQPLVQRSNTTQQGVSNTTHRMPARSLHKTFLIPLATVFDVQGVPGAVREILLEMFDGNWTTWKKVPKKSQDDMYERFQSKFQWDPIHENQVKNIWEDILKRRYRDIIRDARRDAIKLARKSGVTVGDDWTVLKPFHPDWIDAGNWAAMIDECWNTEDWKRKAAKMKRNMATLKEGKMAGHSGGSRSMIHTKVYMEKQKGGPVSFVEVYESYFTKKGSDSSDSREFTTPKAGNIMSEYNHLLVEEFGPNIVDHPTEIVPTLWEKACGGMKKGKLFGASKDILLMAEGTCTQYASYKGGPSNGEVESLREEVKRQKKEVEETKKQAEISEKEAEELKTQVAEMQEREKSRELEIRSLKEQMNVFSRYMQGKMSSSS